MTWSTSTPAGNEQLSQGASRLRSLKSDIQTAFRGNTTDGLEGKFPGSDTANPVFRVRFRKDTEANRPSAADGGIYFNTDKSSLQRSTGSAYEDIATCLPSGTKWVFFQASAPTGWTKSTAHDDKMLSITTSSGGGDGGTIGVSESCYPEHTHAVDYELVTNYGYDVSYQHIISAPFSASYFGTSPIGGSPGNRVFKNMTLETYVDEYSPLPSGIFQYIDVIVCEKD